VARADFRWCRTAKVAGPFNESQRTAAKQGRSSRREPIGSNNCKVVSAKRRDPNGRPEKACRLASSTGGWSVHSQSARELVTDLFKRQSMMALVDGQGYLGADGKTEFAYAHPLFWAPYTAIGDGGAR